MFKRDSYLIGIVAGIIFPVICFGILYGITFYLGSFFPAVHQFTIYKMMFVSVVLNVLPIRYLFVAKELKKTAQGILLITVVLMITVTLSF